MCTNVCFLILTPKNRHGVISTIEKKCSGDKNLVRYEKCASGMKMQLQYCKEMIVFWTLTLMLTHDPVCCRDGTHIQGHALRYTEL